MDGLIGQLSYARSVPEASILYKEEELSLDWQLPNDNCWAELRRPHSPLLTVVMIILCHVVLSADCTVPNLVLTQPHKVGAGSHFRVKEVEVHVHTCIGGPPPLPPKRTPSTHTCAYTYTQETFLRPCS